MNTLEVRGIGASLYRNALQAYSAGAVVVLTLNSSAQAQTGSPRTTSLLALPFRDNDGYPVAPWTDFPVTV